MLGTVETVEKAKAVVLDSATRTLNSFFDSIYRSPRVRTSGQVLLESIRKLGGMFELPFDLIDLSKKEEYNPYPNSQTMLLDDSGLLFILINEFPQREGEIYSNMVAFMGARVKLGYSHNISHIAIERHRLMAISTHR